MKRQLMKKITVEFDEPSDMLYLHRSGYKPEAFDCLLELSRRLVALVEQDLVSVIKAFNIISEYSADERVQLFKNWDFENETRDVFSNVLEEFEGIQERLDLYNITKSRKFPCIVYIDDSKDSAVLFYERYRYSDEFSNKSDGRIVIGELLRDGIIDQDMYIALLKKIKKIKLPEETIYYYPTTSSTDEPPAGRSN